MTQKKPKIAWTRKRPTVPGAYWMRLIGTRSADPINDLMWDVVKPLKRGEKRGSIETVWEWWPIPIALPLSYD